MAARARPLANRLLPLGMIGVVPWASRPLGGLDDALIGS